MSSIVRSTRRVPAIACLSAAIAIGLAVLPVSAVFAQQPTSAAQTQSFDIPAQPLSGAIRQYSRQTGLRVAYDSALGKGVRSSAVDGEYDAQAALQRLLQGTGLGYRVEDDVIQLQKREPPAADAAAGAASASAPASAATGDATTFPTMEVKGQRPGGYTVQSSSSAALLDLAIKDTPQVVHVMTAQRIKDQNLTQVADVLTQAPGFTASQSGIPGAGHIVYYARGFPVTNVMLDGVTTSGNGFNDWDIWGLLDTAVYERVELVQGSTGLSTGVGDPSASVNFVRKRPTATSQGNASLGYGSWNQLRGTVDVSGPLNDAGNLRGRLVGAWQQGDSWQDRVHGRMGTLYGVAEWDAGDSTRVTLGALHTDMRADDVTPWGVGIGNNGESNFLALGRSFNPATDWSRATLVMTNVFARVDQELGDNWKARLNYEFIHVESDRQWGMIGRYSGGGVGRTWGRRRRF
ncbi:MAG: TonB-dependent receptor plug domain-containing protein [Pseudoxanthomonas sp.]